MAYTHASNASIDQIIKNILDSLADIIPLASPSPEAMGTLAGTIVVNAKLDPLLQVFDDQVIIKLRNGAPKVNRTKFET